MTSVATVEADPPAAAAVPMPINPEVRLELMPACPAKAPTRGIEAAMICEACDAAGGVADPARGGGEYGTIGGSGAIGTGGRYIDAAEAICAC